MSEIKMKQCSLVIDLDLKIEDAIKELQALQVKYPGSYVDVAAYESYSNPFAQVSLEYERPYTEEELEEIEAAYAFSRKRGYEMYLILKDQFED